jgi:hypothetical protein
VTDQGELTSSVPVSTTLGVEEMHAWTFIVDEPVEVSIFLLGEEDLDGVLSLYGPDDQLIETVDDSLSGEEELIFGITLEESGEYTVIVSDYAGDGGSYFLVFDAIPV